MTVPTSATKPLGIVLVSEKKVCVLCKRELVIRKDRPSYITVYDIQIGPAPGMHFHKICPSLEGLLFDPVLWLLFHWRS